MFFAQNVEVRADLMPMVGNRPYVQKYDWFVATFFVVALIEIACVAFCLLLPLVI